MKDTEKRLQGSMMRIRGDHPFLGALGLFAEMVVTEVIETAATDGKRLLFNPDFVAKQDTSSLCGLVTHELLHAALLHLSRRGERDPNLWNIAADIVVNGMIRRDTSYVLPQGAVEDCSLDHLSVEEIYEHLRAGEKNIPRITLLDLIGSEGQGIIGQVSDVELRNHWRSVLQQASSVARRVSKGFASQGLDLHRDIAEVSMPSLQWRELLCQFLVATPSDFSGFDRRFLWQKIYLEEIAAESIEVAIAIDTSGSIGNQDLSLFLGEIDSILCSYPQIHGHLFFADVDVYGPYEFNREAFLPSPKGGGGTSFEPFFNWVNHKVDMGERPVCIYFTDGYGIFPSAAPEVPVLWVVAPGGLESLKFPFGDVARIGVGES